MNIQKCSTPDLLSVLVGKGMAKKLSQVPLSVLFGMRANRQEMVCENEAPYVPAPIISAAKELFELWKTGISSLFAASQYY